MGECRGAFVLAPKPWINDVAKLLGSVGELEVVLEVLFLGRGTASAPREPPLRVCYVGPAQAGRKGPERQTKFMIVRITERAPSIRRHECARAIGCSRRTIGSVPKRNACARRLAYSGPVDARGL